MARNLTGLASGPAANAAKWEREHREFYDSIQNWAGCFSKGDAQRTKQLYAERMLTFKEGPRPAGAVVRHLCENDSTSQDPCCNPAHLTWGTPVENAQDGIAAGNRNFQHSDHPTQRTVTCPVCGKVGKEMIMRRWHFDRCRHSLLPRPA